MEENRADPDPNANKKKTVEERPQKRSLLFSSPGREKRDGSRRGVFWVFDDMLYGPVPKDVELEAVDPLLGDRGDLEMVEVSSPCAIDETDRESGAGEGDGGGTVEEEKRGTGLDGSAFWGWDGKKKACFVALVSVIVIGSCAFNMSLYFGNKHVFSKMNFRFPILLTAFHALSGGVYSGVYLFAGRNNPSCSKLQEPDPRRHGLVLMLTALFFAMNVGFNNASLLYMSVGPVQIIRSLNVVFTAVFSVVLLEKRFSLRYWGGVFCISLGIMMSAYGNPTFDFVGAIFAFVSSVSSALTMVFVAKASSMPGLRMDSINTVLWTALPIFAFCMPMFLMWELSDAESYTRSRPSDAALILVATSVFAFFNNALQYELVRLVSPVYCTAAGNLKTVLLFVVVYVVSDPDEPMPTVLNWIGVCVVVSVFFYLNWLYYVENLPPTAGKASGAGASRAKNDETPPPHSDLIL